MNSTIKNWNAAADSFAAAQESGAFALVNKKVVASRFKDLKGRRVLDLGCGYGWYSDYFRTIGADVTGCDGSQRMIELARASYKGCRFDCIDIEDKLPYENCSFDLVFCNQVLMDVENLQAVLQNAYLAAKEGAVFYFSIVHPAFYGGSWQKDSEGRATARIIEKYLSEYKLINRFWGETTHYHRTISSYLNAAIRVGFRLVRLDEPVSYDGVDRSAEIPLFMFAEFIKKFNGGRGLKSQGGTGYDGTQLR